MRRALLAIIIFMSGVVAWSAVYYTSPTGNPTTGDGSLGNPWDFQKAISNNVTMGPGDTLYLRGGVYSNGVEGTYWCNLKSATTPITVTSYPGEHAILDGIYSTRDYNLYLDGSNTFWHGIEMQDSRVSRAANLSTGFHIVGSFVTLSNAVVRNCRGTGVGLWSTATNSDVKNCLIYYNGFDSLNHGIYTQSRDGVHEISGNVIFENAGYSIHAYAEDGSLDGFNIHHNALFNDLGALVGGQSVGRNVTFSTNYVYGEEPRIGYHLINGTDNNDDATIIGNYMAAFTAGADNVSVNLWTNLVFTDNVSIFSSYFQYLPGPTVDSRTIDRNLYYRVTTSSAPFRYGDTGSESFTLINFTQWQALGFDANGSYSNGSVPASNVIFYYGSTDGRGLVVVYNWEALSSVTVDLSFVLSEGQRYQVKNAQDYFGQAVVSGQYSGSIAVPMSAGVLTRETPIVHTLSASPTYPGFNAFIVERLDSAPPTKPRRSGGLGRLGL